MVKQKSCVPPAYVTVKTLRLNVTAALSHSGAGGAWEPDYKLGDLSLLEPGEQALLIRKGLSQKGSVWG